MGEVRNFLVKFSDSKPYDNNDVVERKKDGEKF